MADKRGVFEPDGHADHQDVDEEGYDSGSDYSSLMSIPSSILEGVIGEGQRTYAAYGKEEYGFPMDERELNRIDLCHPKYYALLEKKLYLSPIPNDPERILDLGCGTGIWAVEMADRFPNTEVMGVDIAPTQPEWAPPNCFFELDDIEEEWTFKENNADFIFARDLICAVRDFPQLIDQSYQHLKPGGWLEFQCITGVLGCDDDSVPKDSFLQATSHYFNLACATFGTPVDDPFRWKKWFEERGFVDVEEVIFKLPVSPWADDQRLKLLGMWEQQNLLQGVEGMTMRLFQKGLGWTEDQVHSFIKMLQKDLKDTELHGYWPFVVVRGRKPQ